MTTKTTTTTKTGTGIDYYPNGKTGIAIVTPADPKYTMPLMKALFALRLQVSGGERYIRVNNAPAMDVLVAMIEAAPRDDLEKEAADLAARVAAFEAERNAEDEIKKMTLDQLAAKITEVSGRKLRASAGRFTFEISSAPLSVAHFKALAKILTYSKTKRTFSRTSGVVYLDERLALLDLAAKVAGATEVTVDDIRARQAKTRAKAEVAAIMVEEADNAKSSPIRDGEESLGD